MARHDSPDPMDFARTVPHVLGKRDRPQPELRLSVVALDMDVVAFVAVGHEHEQAVGSGAKEGWQGRSRRGRNGGSASYA